MKIFNVRLGFATNSSSTHSLIIVDDKDLVGLSQNPPDSYEGFGWGNFVLKSAFWKKHYLASMIAANLGYGTDGNNKIVAKCISDLFGPDFLEGKPVQSVDHQSVWSLPKLFGKARSFNKEFLLDLKDFMLQKNVVVLGGNDNSDGHPLSAKHPPNPFIERGLQDIYGSVLCRKDPINKSWTMFSPDNGAKIRFSFLTHSTTPTKSYAPELVDLKITDYCGIGCKFCYQDSTVKGGAAPLSRIKQYIKSLSALEVFEIAIGGGEPTTHPDFLKILSYARRKHVIPNFTTKSMEWLKDVHIAAPILDKCGAFAFSISNAKELSILLSVLDGLPVENRLWQDKLNVQLVLGTISREDFIEILNLASEARVPVTLLGYKYQGRGHQYKPQSYDWWLDVFDLIKSVPTIKVDTALALQYDEELKKRLPQWTYHTSEGKFSAYLDAVEQTLAPSSYCPAEQYVPFPAQSSASDLASVYRNF